MKLGLCLSLALAALAAPAATVETFDGQRFTGDVRFDTNGVVHIATMGTKVVRVSLTNILQATLGPGSIDINDFVALPEGWTSQDIGPVGMPGRAGQSNAAFALRVASGEIGGPSDSFHFLWHPMEGDGQLQVRGVTMRGGDLSASSGLMIREDVTPDAPFVMGSLSAGGRALLRWRTTRGERGGEIAGVRDYAWPQFLQLKKAGQEYTLAVSSDGERWETVASTNVALPARKLHAGLALASHGELSMSTVLLDKLNLRFNGILGHYFARPNWREPILNRIDPQIQFAWRTSVPDPRLQGKKFSVRWQGELVPRSSGDYLFFYETEAVASLWVDGQLLPRRAFKDSVPESATPLSLIAGHRYPLKFEVTHEEGFETARLGWEGTDRPREVISNSELFAVLAPVSPLLTTNRVPALRSWAPAAGVVLRDGSFLSGTVKKVELTELTLSWRNEGQLVLPIHQVARAIFRIPPPDLNIGTATNATGLLLANGDFLEGDVAPAGAQRLEVNSVLFGPREVGVDTGQLLVAVLNRVDALPFRYEVRTTDDSVLRCSALRIEAEELILSTSLPTPLRVRLTNIEQLRGQQNPYLGNGTR